MCCWYILCVLLLFPLCVPGNKPLPQAPLRDFQVSQPLAFTNIGKICSMELVNHSFANSFGQPTIVQYKPLLDCGNPGTWAAISLNLTGTSHGIQFDRLANLYFSGVEIWRTSTPEPTTKGIIWTALKDVSKYSSLFSQEGTILLDLGNLIDPGQALTGVYDVTLTAHFYAASADRPRITAADVILPLSSMNQTQGSAFFVPPAGSTTLTSLPRNIAQAYVEIYASGNANEEFWYGNVPDEFFSRLPEWDAPDGLANPKGPFREVQLLIDGLLAGVVFPYPVIYSGEFLPSIWSPMLSYGALDSPTYYIDVTPFVPHLCDGRAHNFTLDVIGMGVNFSINSNWIVSGNLQLLLDDSDERTAGEILIHQVAPFVTPVVVGSVKGPAPNVTVTSTTIRDVYIQGYLRTGSGKTVTVDWKQQLNFTNTETYATTLGNISTQHVTQLTSGHSISTYNSAVATSDAFEYPLSLNLSYLVLPSPLNQTFFDYGVALQHSFKRILSLGPISGGLETSIDTVQTCKGTEFEHATNVAIRTGTTGQQFKYSDNHARTYFRDVEVATFVNLTTGLPRVSNSSLIHDYQSGSLSGCQT